MRKYALHKECKQKSKGMAEKERKEESKWEKDWMNAQWQLTFS